MSTKILILRCGALGDLIYSTFIINSLKQHFGNDCEIDYILKPPFSDIFKFDTRVDNIFELSQRQWPIFLSSQKKNIIKISKQKQYTLFINFEYNKKFKTLANNIYAKHKIGHFSDNLIYDEKINKKINVVDILKRICKNTIPKEILKINHPILIPNLDDKNFINFLEINKIKRDNYIIIAPSTSHTSKTRIDYRGWLDDRWAKLVDKLSKNYQVIIIGTKNDEKSFTSLAKVCNTNTSKNKIINLFGKTSVNLLVNLVKKSKFLVCCDTGVSHMSISLNTHCFVLLGTTGINAITPPNALSKVSEINKKLKCSPCYKTQTMRDCKDNVCMSSISVNDVLNGIKANIKN